jgi:ribonuclease HI
MIGNFNPKFSPANKVHPVKFLDYKLQFDGCSKGNPGLAGAGAVIYKGSEEIWASSLYIVEKITNNHAEYAGLILGLEQALKMNIKVLMVEGDSMLIINQVIGTYQVKSPSLLNLYKKSKELESKFDEIYFTHIYRNKNSRADELSNIAIKEYVELQNQK